MRKIIHVDCDSFFASVEIRDRPELADKPVAVGGSADRRGVISTCNYIARRFGVHSAMATALALKKCPQLVLISPDFEKYKAASQAIHDIFSRFTDLIEPLSLDEAFLDVTECKHFQGSATLIAEEIRRLIRKEVRITASAGIAPNKFLAKTASDINKPDGQFVITPFQIASFMTDLPVKRIFGVGPATTEKLHQLGIQTCGQMQDWSEYELASKFGSFGQRLFELCRGIDDRPVITERERKSLSVENTFVHDLPTLDACKKMLVPIHARFQSRLDKLEEIPPVKSIFVKIKFYDFTQTTLERAHCEPTEENFDLLLEEAFSRGLRAVRLIGVGVTFEPLKNHEQMDLFDQEGK